MNEVTVTKADHEAAVSFGEVAGEADTSLLAVYFAHHALEAREAGRQEGLEEAREASARFAACVDEKRK